MISIIIRGLGLSSTNTDIALSLSNRLTLSLSPYTVDIQDIAQEARGKGYDLLLQVPMETSDSLVHDPGPYALLTTFSTDDNLARLSMLTSLLMAIQAYSLIKMSYFHCPQNIYAPSLSSLKGAAYRLLWWRLCQHILSSTCRKCGLSNASCGLLY